MPIENSCQRLLSILCSNIRISIIKTIKNIFNSFDRSGFKARKKSIYRKITDSPGDSSLIDVTGGKIRDRRHIDVAQKDDSRSSIISSLPLARIIDRLPFRN